MPISKPLLPPLRGYVEVEVGGVRRYRNIETGYIVGEEPEPEPTAQEDNDAMLVDHEYRLTLLELGVTSDAV